MGDLVPPQRGDDEPSYEPTCTPCVLTIPHDHPAGRAPLWPCLHCHNAKHRHCDSTEQFCSCDCGLKET